MSPRSMSSRLRSPMLSGCDEVGGLLTGSTHFGDMPGDDAEYLASIVADFLSDDFHEASVGPSVY